MITDGLNPLNVLTCIGLVLGVGAAILLGVFALLLGRRDVAKLIAALAFGGVDLYVALLVIAAPAFGADATSGVPSSLTRSPATTWATASLSGAAQRLNSSTSTRLGAVWTTNSGRSTAAGTETGPTMIG